jgi:serine/threonine kinase 38
MSPEAQDLINKLLDLNPKNRIGSKGIQEIKDHGFFTGIQWEKIMDEPVPFIPAGREIDTGYFPNANAHDEELK